MLTGRIKVRKSDLIEVVNEAKQAYLKKFSEQETFRLKIFNDEKKANLNYLKKVKVALDKDIALLEKGKPAHNLNKLNVTYYRIQVSNQPFQTFEPNTTHFDQDLKLLDYCVEDTITIGVTSQFAKYF